MFRNFYIVCIKFSMRFRIRMCIQQNRHASLQWRHNERDGDSNHQPHDYLLNRLLRRGSKKTPKSRITGLCAGTGEFPALRASNAENVWFDYVIMMFWKNNTTI